MDHRPGCKTIYSFDLNNPGLNLETKMCKVYNMVGSLTTIKRHFNQNKIDNFNSLDELISFQNNYSASRELVISNQRLLITEERNNLNAVILQLENEITNDKRQIRQRLKSEIESLNHQFDAVAEAQKSFIQEFTYSFKALFLFIKIKYRELFSNIIISFLVRSKVKILDKKRKHFQYLVSHLEKAVRESSRLALFDLDRKKIAIDEINTFIYGAIGEQKVAKELDQLSDEYILINDFCYSFTKAIYNNQEKHYIKSIQIDHLLIAPSGIFLIETKNWSKDSLKNLSLRSPMQQIKRTNFALFKILSGNANFKLDQHHWGERKIPIRNLIVLINHKPTEEFQYVKILTLDELLGYIVYFKPCLSNQETQEIAKYLLNIGIRI